MTSKTGRASFSASTSALLAVPYSVTPGESRNFDLTTSSHAVSAESTTDPAYLFIQVHRINNDMLSEIILSFFVVKKC